MDSAIRIKGASSILFLGLVIIISLKIQALHQKTTLEYRTLRYKKEHNLAKKTFHPKVINNFIYNSPSTIPKKATFRHGEINYYNESLKSSHDVILFRQNPSIQVNWSEIKKISKIINSNDLTSSPKITLNNLSLSENISFSAHDTEILGFLQIDKNNIILSFLGNVKIKKLTINNLNLSSNLKLIAFGNITINEIDFSQKNLKSEVDIISTSKKIIFNPTPITSSCSCASPASLKDTCIKISNFKISSCKIIVNQSLLSRGALIYE